MFCLTILSFLVWPYLVTANLDSRVVFAFDSDEANHIELLKQALETSGFDFNFHGYGHLFFNIALITLRFFSTLDLPTDQIIIIVLRSISLISGLLCVSITFFLAKRFFGQSCAILSTAFLVAIPLEFQSYAGISHPDLLQLVFVQLALYYCCLCATSKRFLHLKIASAFSCIAFATKYSGLFLLPLLFVQSFGLHPTSLRFSLPQVRLLRLTTFVFAAVSAAIGVISTPEFVLKVTHSNDQLLSSEAALLFTLRITAMIVAGLALVLVL